jgi:pectate lyase
MKDHFWKFALIPCLCVIYSSVNVHSQNPYYMSGPVGYGSATTGGGAPTSSNTVTVTTSSELSSALSGSKSVILVSGSITTGPIECTASNKSIIGLPGAKLVNTTQTKAGSGNLILKKGTSNIIIRNITFVGPGAYDEDGSDLITNEGCTKLWVDHCEFQDGMDGNFDNTKLSDNITVSWCKFTYLKAPKAGGSGNSDDHRFSNLVGGSETDAPSDGKYSITWINCWWTDGCVDRMVRARNAQNDILNCYWNSKVASKNIHVSPGSNGTYIYVENGVFACTGDIVNEEETGNNNVKFVNCTGGVKDLNSVSAPSYSWTKTPVGDVVSMVSNSTCGAGAKLQVTAAGVISSSCGGTEVTQGVESEKNSSLIQIDNDLNVNFSASSSENANVTLFSMTGQKVFSLSNKANSKESVKPNLQGINSGVYLVKVRNNNSITTSKFIKK